MEQTQKTFFTISTDIANLLIGDQRIVDVVGNKVFPLIAAEGTTGSFITYRRDAYSRDQNKMCVSSDEAKVYLVAVSDSYDESQNLAVLINDIVEGDHDGYTCELVDSTEDFSDKKFIQILLFKIN